MIDDTTPEDRCGADTPDDRHTADTPDDRHTADTREESHDPHGPCTCGEHDPPADAPSRERVLAALREVTDPDMGGNVVESGVVGDVTVDGGEVRLSVATAGMAPAAAEELTEGLRGAVLSVPGVTGAVVEPADGGAGGGHGQPGAEADAATGLDLDGVDHVVAVASAKGGVGKSTVAVGLARALAARGADVGVFDADIHGPNVHRLLGAEGPVETTDDGRAAPVEADGLETMSVGLLAGDEPLAWRGAMANEALRDLLDDTAWTDRDVLVVDLPPGTGDVVLTTLDAVPLDGVVLVTTPFPTAVADTGRTANLVRDQGHRVLGVVRNMAGFECEACGHHHTPFEDAGDGAGDVSDEPDNVGDGAGDVGDGADAAGPEAAGEGGLSAPTLAELPLTRRVREGVRPGTDAPLPAGLRSLADAVVDRLDDDTGVDLPPSALDLRGVPAAPAVEQALAEFRATEPGEPLYLHLDRDPEPLCSALAGDVGVDIAALPVTVDRRGPSEWAVRVRAPDGEGDAASRSGPNSDAAGGGRP